MRKCVALVALLGVNLVVSGVARGETPIKAQSLLEKVVNGLTSRSDMVLTESSWSLNERRYRLALGAIQKVRGIWAPEHSIRVDGDLGRWTWRVEPGFVANDILADAESIIEEATTADGGVTVEGGVAGEGSVSLLYACDARACGSSVQWANRIFDNRILYGTEASQRYRVYALSEGEQPSAWLVLYASARTSSRQHIHAEILNAASPNALSTALTVEATETRP